MDSQTDWHGDFVASLLALQETAPLFSRDEAGLADQFLPVLSSIYSSDFIFLSRVKGEERVLLGSGPERDGGPSAFEALSRILENVEGDESWEMGDFFFRDYPPPVSRRIIRLRSFPGENGALELIMVNAVIPNREGFFPESLRLLFYPVARAWERGQLEKRILRMEKEVSRVLDSKTQFLGSLSHEIRSPLNGIICMGSLLRETELDEEQMDLLNIIQFSADNITRIIQNLIDLTLLTSGRVILKKETFSLATLCRNLMKNMQEEVENKGLTLGLKIEEGVDSFHGDSVRIGQILSNLLQNGVKYTKEGEVFLDIRRRGESVEFVVSDTGVGIPQEKQEFIFEEFTQLGSPVQKGQSRGIGLGLAIVKDLVEIMGGDIVVRSREGKGSSFIVNLPNLVEEEGSPDYPEEESPLTPMEDSCILVVDDDEINRLYLKTTLEGRGARIDEAENGQIAIEKVAGKKYDLILMDISMPVMNGLDATREIRKLKKNLPVLAVTANAFEEDFKRILESGLDDIVLKPVDEEQLMVKIATWLERRRRETHG